MSFTPELHGTGCEASPPTASVSEFEGTLPCHFATSEVATQVLYSSIGSKDTGSGSEWKMLASSGRLSGHPVSPL